MQHRQLPEGWDKDLPTFPADAKGLATRDASGKVLNAIGKNVPWLMGGSADLAPSCKTRLTFDGAGDFFADSPGGRNLHFGIREHAMAAVLNGMALVKVRAYGSTFLIFSDYARPAIRLSALMELPVIYVFTHDSIGVGEDGPTHQPIEQLASLRAIPGLIVLRPADANEVAEAWKVIMKLHHEPAVLVLTRQAVPTIDRSKYASASGRGPRGLRPGRRAGRQAGRPAAGDRQRGGAVPGSVRAAQGGGNQGAGGEHAVVGIVRRPAAGVPRPRAAAGGDGAGLGGAGLDVRLGQVRRRHGTQHRHAFLRRVGPAEGPGQEVRLHAGTRRGRGQGAAGREQSRSLMTMGENIEQSLLELDFASLRRRTFTPSPAAWEDQVLYFLLLDRFSDGKEKDGYRDIADQPVQTGTTPLYRPEDPGRIEYDAWFRAGGGWQGGTLQGLKSKLGYLRRPNFPKALNSEYASE